MVRLSEQNSLDCNMPDLKSSKPSTGKTAAGNTGETSLTAQRALKVLACFLTGKTELGAAEIARRIGISKTATLRLLNTLEREFFLQQDTDTRKYTIGIRAYQVGQVYPFGQMLGREADTLMRSLVAETGHSCYLTTLQHDHMVIQSIVEGTGPIRFSMTVGTRLSLHGSSNGRAALSTMAQVEINSYAARHTLGRAATKRLLCDVEEVRERGYGVAWGENIPGVGGVAAPLFDGSGSLLATISFGFAISQLTRAQCDGLGERLKAASAAFRLGRR